MADYPYTNEDPQSPYYLQKYYIENGNGGQWHVYSDGKVWVPAADVTAPVVAGSSGVGIDGAAAGLGSSSSASASSTSTATQTEIKQDLEGGGTPVAPATPAPTYGALPGPTGAGSASPTYNSPGGTLSTPTPTPSPLPGPTGAGSASPTYTESGAPTPSDPTYPTLPPATGPSPNPTNSGSGAPPSSDPSYPTVPGPTGAGSASPTYTSPGGSLTPTDNDSPEHSYGNTAMPSSTTDTSITVSHTDAGGTPSDGQSADTVINNGAGNYVVKEGDTLSGIAAAHGYTTSQLEAANTQITDPNLIHPGEEVNFPKTSTFSPEVTAGGATAPPTATQEAGWVNAGANEAADITKQVIEATDKIDTDPTKGGSVTSPFK